MTWLAIIIGIWISANIAFGARRIFIGLEREQIPSAPSNVIPLMRRK